MRRATRTGVVRDEGGMWRQWVGADEACRLVTMRRRAWMHGRGLGTDCDGVLGEDGIVAGVQWREWKREGGRGSWLCGGVGTSVVCPESVPALQGQAR